jgi:hypothetical protein
VITTLFAAAKMRAEGVGGQLLSAGNEQRQAFAAKQYLINGGAGCSRNTVRLLQPRLLLALRGLLLAELFALVLRVNALLAL